MRSCHVIYFMLAVFLAAPSVGCKTFRKNDRLSSNSSMLGLKKGKKKSREEPDETLDPLGARNSNRLLWDDLAPNQIGTTIKTRWIGGPDEGSAQSELNRGQDVFGHAAAQLESDPDGEAHVPLFIEAANAFRTASASAPDSEIEEEALKMEGEAYFFANRFVQSNRAFEKLLANYSGTRYLDQAEQKRFAIAQYWLELAETDSTIKFGDAKRPRSGMTGEARRVLHRIRVDDPTGKYADDATLELAKAFMRDGNYYEAADTFSDLRQNYPGSKYQFTAHMLELESRLKGYQGSSYDATPLITADELLNQIVRRFPEQSQEQLPYLEQQAGMIRNQLAERDYALGDYYAGRGQNRAAKLAFEQVAQNYGETQYGKSVSERIADVSAKPAVPTQHAKWLVDMFPDSGPVRPVIASGDRGTKLR